MTGADHAGRRRHRGAAGVHRGPTATAASPFRAKLLQPGDNRRLKGEDLRRASRRCAAANASRPPPAGWSPASGLATVPVRAPAARGLLFHRRRDPEPGRAAARRRGVRQQPLHGVRPAQTPGLRSDRHGRGARRSGFAGGCLCRRGRQSRRHHHQRRRQRRRGRLHQGHDEETGRRGVLENRDASGPAHGRGTHRQLHPLRPAGQSRCGDGDLSCLRAPGPAAHDGLQRTPSRRCCRRAAARPSARRPAAPNTSAAWSRPRPMARCKCEPPATRVPASSAPWCRPTA